MVPLYIKAITFNAMCDLLRRRLKVKYNEQAKKLDVTEKTLARWRKYTFRSAESDKSPYKQLSDENYASLLNLIKEKCMERKYNFTNLMKETFEELEKYPTEDDIKLIITNSLDYHLGLLTNTKSCAKDTVPVQTSACDNTQALFKHNTDTERTRNSLPKAPDNRKNTREKTLTPYTKLENRSKLENRLSLENRFDHTVSVDICAMACQGILTYARDHFEQLLQNGCQIRILINNPKSHAAAYSAEYLIASGTLRTRKKIIPLSYDNLLEWLSAYPTCISGRITDLQLLCAIMIIRKKNIQENTIKVDYYAYNCPDGERRCLYIPYSDRENYSFYERQFEWLWNQSSQIK